MTTHTDFSARILLVDDHPAVRQGLRMLLEGQGHQVVAEAGTISEALEQVKNAGFDVALLDLALQEESGLILLPELENQGISGLVYTMHEEPGVIERAFREGALGYVTKREETDILIQAVETVLHGKRYLSPYAAESLKGKESDRSLEDRLSTRERQIFDLTGEGLGNSEIAENLDISPRTIETYFTRMVNKLDFKNRRELRKYAVSVSR